MFNLKSKIKIVRNEKNHVIIRGAVIVRHHADNGAKNGKIIS